MGEFALAISKFAAKAEANADKVVANVVLEVRNRLVLRSPVDTGRFRSNWFISEGQRASGTTSATTPDAEQGIATLEKAAGKLFFIQNNLPYGPTLEYGGYPNPPKSKTGKTIDGFSTQAPAGMVGLTVLEFASITDAEVQKVKT
jgi:hypothetical protein